MEISLIQNKIHEGLRVLLDFDLADLYQIENKYLRRAVRANLRRFPTDFMFELSKEEFLRCKTSTSKRGGTRYMPFAFTEHGVAMLATVLNTDKAIDMNINIIRAFIALKQLVFRAKGFNGTVKRMANRITSAN